MKLRQKLMFISLIPITLMTVESIFFTWLYLKDYPQARQVMMMPLCRIGLITLAITFVVVFFIVKNLAGSISSVCDTLQTLSDGDLNVNIDQQLLHHKDETGTLAQSAAALKESLTAIISQLHHTSERLSQTARVLSSMTENTSSVSEGLSTAMSDIAQGTASEAASTQNVSEQMQTIRTLADLSTKNTENFRLLIEQINRASSQGLILVQNLDEHSELTRHEIQAIALQTQATHQASQEIQAAAEFIASIASQTNLLALNASIEAARAGEQGRGFAVVAEQIKTLAEQSSASAQNIDHVIQNLLTESEKTIECMNRVQEASLTEDHEIKETHDLFSGLGNDISKAADEIRIITGHLENLSDAEANVMTEIDSLQATTQETAASTQEITASSEELTSTAEELSSHSRMLADLSDSLKEQIEKFRLN